MLPMLRGGMPVEEIHFRISKVVMPLGRNSLCQH
jgi:hypothetical protein